MQLRKSEVAQAGRLLESVSVTSEDERQRNQLRKQLRANFVAQTTQSDPYADKEKERKEFLQKV